MYLLGTSRHARFSFFILEQTSDTASLVFVGTGVVAASFGVLMNSALTTVPFLTAAATGSFWCFMLRNGSCLGRTALLRGVVSAFFLALGTSILATLVRTGDARRAQIRWAFSRVFASAFSAASVAVLSLARRALGGFGGAECGHFSIELWFLLPIAFCSRTLGLLTAMTRMRKLRSRASGSTCSWLWSQPTRRQNQAGSSTGRAASGAVRSTNLGASMSS
uniref:Uncharacterized protein n=1 Tax=Arundo donax TaxID=35708 RepID=A0A0A9AVG4_ARUDO